MKLVIVVWDDASTVDASPWVDRTDAPTPKPCVFHQVGWLVDWTKDHLILTQAAGDHLMAARERIPRGMVKAVLELDPAAGVPLKLPRRRKTAS